MQWATLYNGTSWKSSFPCPFRLVILLVGGVAVINHLRMWLLITLSHSDEGSARATRLTAAEGTAAPSGLHFRFSSLGRWGLCRAPCAVWLTTTSIGFSFRRLGEARCLPVVIIHFNGRFNEITNLVLGEIVRRIVCGNLHLTHTETNVLIYKVYYTVPMVSWIWVS